MRMDPDEPNTIPENDPPASGGHGPSKPPTVVG